MFASSDDKRNSEGLTDCLRFKLFTSKLQLLPNHTNVNCDLLHLIDVFAVISLKMSHVRNVKKAGSFTEGSAIISPPTVCPGNAAEINVEINMEIW